MQCAAERSASATPRRCCPACSEATMAGIAEPGLLGRGEAGGSERISSHGGRPGLAQFAIGLLAPSGPMETRS